jgi:hypothetical protein
MALPRRGALLAGLGLAACGRTPEEAFAPGPPPSYAYLLPLRLAVGRIEVLPAANPAATRTMPPAPLVPADVVRTMAEERLQAAGGPATGRFRIQIATLTREPASGGGVFGTATERLNCILRCRLDIVGEDGAPVGFAEAEVNRATVRPAETQADRARAADEIVRQAGRDLNVEFEFQLRRNLRALLRAPEPPGGPAEPPAEGAPTPPEALSI